MSKLTTTTCARVDAMLPSASPHRFYPSHGQALIMDCTCGKWRPSGAFAIAGVFAVVWTTRSGDFWALVHDFCAVEQQRLIEDCRQVDRLAFRDCKGRRVGATP